MQAEIIMIGTELLLGQIVDTNAAYLARQVAALGIDVFRKTTVGDNEQRIADAVRKALGRCDVVITSGGLGPTVDDKTRSAVASATDQPLILDKRLLEFIANFFKRRGLELGENNKRQAYIPQGSIPIENPVGTAPGFIVEHKGSCVISLPGVPRELHYLTEHTVLPFLRKRFGIKTVIKIRLLRTAGIGESNIDRMIDDLEQSTNPTIGLAAHPGSVDIRICAKAENEKAANHLLDKMEAEVRLRVGNIIYGTDNDTIERAVVKLLQRRGLTVSIVETNTGGSFASRLTQVPGGFQVLKKAQTLSIHKAIEQLSLNTGKKPDLGADYANAVASHIRKVTGADLGFAIIGDEDPNAGPFRKIPGNTYIGIDLRGSVTNRHLQIGGIVNDARIRITSFAFEALRRRLTELEKED
ncbi:MAG: CinA family nicotinamide mononucleotide deamidase-related protein [Deltaproteobacteria bacterium]|nr:CinA family nicotinamide mononucleotide deamidase-related protein [Deltaproteobacteria bacterium]MBW2151399.1 CinA family nicotinamide mononucleotide deamidase-related protein [Deltaproteobacteria bacterium]